MKRTRISVGSKSLERGSTFNPPSRTSQISRGSFTGASLAQRDKVGTLVSVVSGKWPCDPAHLTPRSRGGCDDPLCVIPLTRSEHRAFDDGTLDILGALITAGYWAELGHAIAVHRVDPLSLIHRCTGERHTPERTL